MLSEFDDYLCHQITDVIDNPYTSDLRFYCRHFMLFYSMTGDICGLTGMAVYPNTEVMDGYAILVLDDKEQRSLRVSRKLQHDRHNTVVGPVRIEVIDGLRRFRIACGDNPHNFAYDIVCESTTRPYERGIWFEPRRNGRVVNNTNMFTQTYRCRGRIVIDGKTHEVTPDKWFGARDHSWGITPRFWDGAYAYGPTGPGQGPSRGPYGQGIFPVGGVYARHDSWVTFMKDGRDVCYFDFWLSPGHLEGGELIYPWGDPRPPVKLVGIERKNVIWGDRGKQFKSLDLVVTDEHGEKHEMHVRRISTVYERGAGYQDCGTPFVMGKPMGQMYMESDTWNVDQNPDKYRGRNMAHVSEYRWGDMVGYGMFECNDDALFKRPYAKYSPPTVTTKAEQR